MKTKSFVIIFIFLQLNLFSQDGYIELDVNLNNAKKNVKVSELFTDFRFLALETTRKSLIGEIVKVRHINNRIYILDSYSAKSLFVFDDKTGRFLFKIKAKGTGPGEFTQINDFCIDRSTDIIYILANSREIFTYDHSGQFIEDFRIGFAAHKFSIIDKESFVFHGGGTEHNIILTDENFNTKNKMFPHNHRRLNYINTFSNKPGGTIYSRIYNCSFYTFADYTAIKYIQLNIKGARNNEEIIKKELSKGNNNPIPNLYKDGTVFSKPVFSRNLEHLYVRLIHANEKYFLFASVNTQKAKLIESNSLINDIIEGSVFYYPSYTMNDNDEVVFLMDPYSLKKRRDSINSQQLLEISDNLKDMSNPVLMFAKINNTSK